MRNHSESILLINTLLLTLWLPLRSQAQQALDAQKAGSFSPVFYTIVPKDYRNATASLAHSPAQRYPVESSFIMPPPGISAFCFMEGVWKGNGWILNGDTKQFFKETETVTAKLSGTVIQIEAFGVAVDDKAHIINDALGLLLYNNETKKYELHIYQSDGSKTVADAKFNNEGEMEWGLAISATVKIKYVITVKDNKWHEAGFKSIDDGLSWKQNFEMNLLKNKYNKYFSIKFYEFVVIARSTRTF